MRFFLLAFSCLFSFAFGVNSDANTDVKALVSFGARVSGSQNLENAAQYLLSEYRKIGADSSIQTFHFSRLRDVGSYISVGGKRFEADALFASSVSDLEAEVVAVPNQGARSDYNHLDVRGRIVLVKRGGIPFLEKARAAQSAKAIGVVIVNSVPGRLSANLLGEFDIPVLAISGTDGTALYNQALRTSFMRLRLVSGVRENQIVGKNVVAKFSLETPKLIVGGHFDSVPGSPGANDNASGTAVILEMARRLPDTLRKQIWFVSFDAEEDGLVGSAAFAAGLPNAEIPKIKAMLNFDMVGVNNNLAVGGSSSLVDLVRGIDPKIGSFNDFSGSDHASFIAEGIPAVFFWRGFEPNYHLPSDTSINPKLLEEVVQIGLETVRRLL
ncbi:MAG: M28 family peptidase [Deinococcales bacterium]